MKKALKRESSQQMRDRETQRGTHSGKQQRRATFKTLKKHCRATDKKQKKGKALPIVL